MQYLTNASVEGMSLLHLKGGDRGSTTDLQQYKSLQGGGLDLRREKNRMMRQMKTVALFGSLSVVSM